VVDTVTKPANADLSPALEVSKRPRPTERIRHLWQYRELVGNLTRKELKVKYKNSVLGFAWSLLNPLMYLVVFSLVFGEVLDVNIPYYGLFFLSGLLAWNLFSTGLSAGTSAIVANAQLVTKVWFPRESLVIASVAGGRGPLPAPEPGAHRRAAGLPAHAGPGVLPGVRASGWWCCS
jgi:hypothetical protein